MQHGNVAFSFSEDVTKHDGKKEKVSERSGNVKKDKVMVDIGVYVGNDSAPHHLRRGLFVFEFEGNYSTLI